MTDPLLFIWLFIWRPWEIYATLPNTRNLRGNLRSLRFLLHYGLFIWLFICLETDFDLPTYSYIPTELPIAYRSYDSVAVHGYHSVRWSLWPVKLWGMPCICNHGYHSGRWLLWPVKLWGMPCIFLSVARIKGEECMGITQ